MQTEPKNGGRSVVLVGLMGAGKSTIGRRLAKRLGIGFTDADEEIEKAADLTIAEIFERFGEAYFRNGERRVIARLVQGPRRVVATGGGAFIDSETRALIKKRAVSVWLDADIDTLVERVSRRSHRPLLRGRDARAVLMELAAKRNPVYAEADHRISSSAAPHDVAVGHIYSALKQAGHA